VKYFVGIDPGETGGLGIVDDHGQYVAALRWDRRRPVTMFERLVMIAPDTRLVYLEKIAAFPGEGLGHVVQTLPLSVNWGIWKGFLIAAGLTWVEVSPPMWQSAWKLTKWAKLLREGKPTATPLSTARERWPGAPLEFQADDGKAVALLLAGLARWDHSRTFDRAAALEHQADKVKEVKRRARAVKKAIKDQAKTIDPWGIAPPAASQNPIF
jgi:hypothetical protein